MRKLYPYLLEKPVQKLRKEELSPIKKNVKALIIHKIGEISVYQTDNIIISMFEGIKTVGLVSNYTLLISSVKGFVDIIFNSAIPSFGNLMANSDDERKYELFRCYKFLGFWVYGFCSIAFAILASPFITLWVGESRTISYGTVLLLIADFYLVGQRICMNNVKVAGGVFWQDRYVAFLQAIVNVVISIVMIKKIGLPGVYVGTIVQGLISTIIKPIIVYRDLFKVKPSLYFRQGLGNLLVTILAGAITYIISNTWLAESTILNFMIRMIVVIVIPNLTFMLVYSRTKEFAYLKGTITRVIKRKV